MLGTLYDINPFFLMQRCMGWCSCALSTATSITLKPFPLVLLHYDMTYCTRGLQNALKSGKKRPFLYGINHMSTYKKQHMSTCLMILIMESLHGDTYASLPCLVPNGAG